MRRANRLQMAGNDPYGIGDLPQKYEPNRPSDWISRDILPRDRPNPALRGEKPELFQLST